MQRNEWNYVSLSHVEKKFWKLLGAMSKVWPDVVARNTLASFSLNICSKSKLSWLCQNLVKLQKFILYYILQVNYIGQNAQESPIHKTPLDWSSNWETLRNTGFYQKLENPEEIVANLGKIILK